MFFYSINALREAAGVSKFGGSSYRNSNRSKAFVVNAGHQQDQTNPCEFVNQTNGHGRQLIQNRSNSPDEQLEKLSFFNQNIQFPKIKNEDLLKQVNQTLKQYEWALQQLGHEWEERDQCEINTRCRNEVQQEARVHAREGRENSKEFVLDFNLIIFAVSECELWTEVQKIEPRHR